MGFEIKYLFHPKKEEGGYDTRIKEEKTAKVGKPFDDTPLEKCAAAITAQLARRDIWVVDVEVYELVKKQISFKEAKNGKGIVLKNKRFSLNSTAQMLSEIEVEEELAKQEDLQPHQLTKQSVPPKPPKPPPLDNLYNNTGSLNTKSSRSARDVNKNRVLYYVYYEPYFHKAEAESLKLKFSEDTRYPVHEVIPSVTGKIDAQKIAVTDDSGQVMILDEKFFAAAGKGLVGDDEVGFSEPRSIRRNNTKLLYDKASDGDIPQIRKNIPSDIPFDDGSIPDELLQIPDIRSKF